MKKLAITTLAALAVGLVVPSVSTASAVSREDTITVVIHRIKAVSNFDGDFLKKDRADFYANVSIGGYWVKSPVWHGQDDARPSWAGTEYGIGTVVPITIQVMDEDGAFEDKDDHADINDKEGVKDIQIWYNTQTGRISGDVSGRKGEKLFSRGAGKDNDKAEIWFSVS
jgi:hypothetical protein